MREFEELDRQYENKIAATYNDQYHRSPIMQSYDADFAEYVASIYKKGDRVLDLGCGSASLWPYWKKHLPEPQCLIGLDLSEEMINQSRKTFPDDHFICGSMFDIPLETGSIDLIIVSSVLHHVPDESLPDIFKEMNRILNEHGTVVGREPVSRGRLGDAPGWLSGALMSFRHMVYRITNTREYPEPVIHEYHHAYNPKKFVKILETFFAPKSLSFRHPLSSYVTRCEHPLVSKITTIIDNAINHVGGHEFYYTAIKNYCDAEDVALCIENELNSETSQFDKKEFMALLQKAAEILEKEINQH